MRYGRRAGSVVVAAAAAALVAAVVAVGFGSSAERVGASAAPSGDDAATPIVDCESRIQVGLPDPGPVAPKIRRASVFAGPVMFLGARTYRNDPRKLFKPRRPGGLRPAKIPIEVEADHEVTISVAPPDGHRALLTVGRDEAPYSTRGTSVTLRSCPAETEVPGQRFGPRTPFLAGFKVDAPICLGIEVAVAGAAEPITGHIAFGKRTNRTCQV